MLGNKSQKMNLEYGKKYFMEVYINTERLNFTNNSQRQIFQSSVGNVSSVYINWTTSINMPAGQNVSTGLGGWFKGLFNWVIGSSSQNYLSFNGSTLELTENVTKWLYNQTSIGGTYNATYALYAYNQTYSGSTYNATYNLWAYNQTTVSTSTYNETYNLYAYNQTYSGGTYNATYALYAYNQTAASGWNVSGTNLYTGNLGYKVGIGTASPSLKLEVNGSVNISNGNLYVNGSADFAGGWQNGGITISEGKLFAQTGYFYNITSLTVNNLNVNASMIPSSGFDNQFDLGSSGIQWRNGYFGTDVLIAGGSVKQWMYNQTTAAVNNISQDYIPYNGAIRSVNLGINNLTINGRTIIGSNATSILDQPSNVKLYVNGSVAMNKDIKTSDYTEVVPGIYSTSVGQSFTTQTIQESSNSISATVGLADSVTVPATFHPTGTVNVYGTVSSIIADAGSYFSKAVGLISDLTIDGNVTNVYGLELTRTITGNITNLYGIYLQDMSTSANPTVINGY